MSTRHGVLGMHAVRSGSRRSIIHHGTRTSNPGKLCEYRRANFIGVSSFTFIDNERTHAPHAVLDRDAYIPKRTCPYHATPRQILDSTPREILPCIVCFPSSRREYAGCIGISRLHYGTIGRCGNRYLFPSYRSLRYVEFPRENIQIKWMGYTYMQRPPNAQVGNVPLRCRP